MQQAFVDSLTTCLNEHMLAAWHKLLGHWATWRLSDYGHAQTLAAHNAWSNPVPTLTPNAHSILLQIHVQSEMLQLLHGHSSQPYVSGFVLFVLNKTKDPDCLLGIWFFMNVLIFWYHQVHWPAPFTDSPSFGFVQHGQVPQALSKLVSLVAPIFLHHRSSQCSCSHLDPGPTLYHLRTDQTDILGIWMGSCFLFWLDWALETLIGLVAVPEAELVWGKLSWTRLIFWSIGESCIPCITDGWYLPFLYLLCDHFSLPGLLLVFPYCPLSWGATVAIPLLCSAFFHCSAEEGCKRLLYAVSGCLLCCSLFQTLLQQ